MEQTVDSRDKEGDLPKGLIESLILFNSALNVICAKKVVLTLNSLGPSCLFKLYWLLKNAGSPTSNLLIPDGGSPSSVTSPLRASLVFIRTMVYVWYEGSVMGGAEDDGVGGGKD